MAPSARTTPFARRSRNGWLKCRFLLWERVLPCRGDIVLYCAALLVNEMDGDPIPMNLLVFVKQVPDTETRIQLQGGAIDTSSVKWVANPYDEFAIEEALRIREKLGQGKVTVVSLGPDRVKDAIKYALSLGADEGVHIQGDGVALSDPLAVATVLAAAAKKAGFDLILTGKQGVDHDWSQVGIILAELLDLPHVSVVVHLEV